MKTAELTGAQLDYWVAMAGGGSIVAVFHDKDALTAALLGHHIDLDTVQFPVFAQAHGDTITVLQKCPQFSTDWDHGGPIIDRERIGSWFGGWRPGEWTAGFGLNAVPWGADGTEGSATIECQHEQQGPTALIAAMRAYVASKFGEEVSDG